LVPRAPDRLKAMTEKVSPRQKAAHSVGKARYEVPPSILVELARSLQRL
jgi:hypothetical protein